MAITGHVRKDRQWSGSGLALGALSPLFSSQFHPILFHVGLIFPNPRFLYLLKGGRVSWDAADM